MTDTGSVRFTIEGTKAIERQAAAWLQRQQFWNWTADEQAEFDGWLKQSTSNRIAYVRVKDAWDRTQRLTIMRSPTAMRSSPRPPFRILPTLLKAVAVLVVASAIGVATDVYLSAPYEKVIATAIGERQVITLQDRSTIELSTNTTVRILQTRDGRIVKLDRGEAYFQVTHDAARPFTVIAGDRQITDLGTKFAVRRDPNRLDIAVTEGKVLFDADRNERKRVALLTAGDELIATDSAVTQFRRSNEELSNRLGWRRGVLVFKNTPLVDAVAEFNRYHREQLVVLNPKTARLTIGGTFETNNIQSFTEVAQDVLGLRADKRGNEIVLSR